MRLQVLLPSNTLLDKPVVKVIAEAENGAFCLLPRHADFVAALVPGLLIYLASSEGQPLQEGLLAVAEGTLVKCGATVSVSVRDAVVCSDLAMVRATVERRFRHFDDQQKKARSALARLEASVVRRFAEIR